MSAFHGPQGGPRKSGKNKGVQAAHRQVKREEAEERNAATDPTRRRQYRLDLSNPEAQK